MRPAPISTVPDVKSTFVSLKRDMATCIPLVEENPGFVACPPPFTAKDVRLDPMIRSYENVSQQKLVVYRIMDLTISLTSSVEPGSTEQADSSVLERETCEMSDK